MTSKKKSPNSENMEQNNNSLLDKISLKKGVLFSALLIAVTIVIFYKPYVIDRLEPLGGDKIGAIGKTHQIREYNKNTNDIALWNPNIFCGIPTYYRLSPKVFHFDTLIRFLGPILDWKIGWFIIAGIGIFLIVLRLGFPWYFALTATVTFLFLPHFQALITVGHDAKTMAIMAMPLVLYGFLIYLKRVDIFSLCVFILAFSLQIRTQHYQIIFYTLLLLLAIGIRTIIKLIKEKKTLHLLKTLTLFFVGLIISILVVAQPLFIVNEYTPYSTRGGDAINLSENGDTPKQSGGVSFEYATRWSVHPKELMALISPRFFGGTSQEYYTGNKFTQLKNRVIPGYWGEMPFTQSSEYMGIIIVILAIAGIWFYRKDGFIIALSILLAFSLLLAFGRHFSPLYKLLFYYLPYFSKFRAPMMILVLTQFLMIILCMYGLKAMINDFTLKKYKSVLIISGVFFLVGLVPILNPGILSYTSAGDAQYASKPEVLDMLKTARMEMMVQDTTRMLIIIAVFIGIFSAFYFKKINRDLLVIGVILLISVDMISVSYRFIKHSKLVNPDRIEQQYFKTTKTDQILSKDTDHYRILALGNLFQSNDLAYRHQIIGGYSAIKPQLIQDIIDNNLYTNNPKEPVNWNVINMLNGKYILSPAQLQYPGLAILDVNQDKRTILYRNDNSLPRAYFVASVNTLSNEKDLVEYLNNPNFDPSIMAITAETPEKHNFNTDATVSITNYTPNQIDLTALCRDTSFLVLSEAYYPVGWKALIDKKPTHIYQVNHLLRGITVPPGDHKITFRFAPRSYYRSKWLSIVFVYLTWLTLIISVVYRNRERLNIKIKQIRKRFEHVK
ncbi:YfhO family protein [bacterium]|nr:YfhO family protein [bacterium]